MKWFISTFNQKLFIFRNNCMYCILKLIKYYVLYGPWPSKINITISVPVNVPNHRYFFFKVFVFPESFDWELLPKKITPSRHLNLLNLKKNPVFLSVRTGLNKLYFIQEVSIQALINNLFSHSSTHFLIFRLEENKFILTKYFVSLPDHADLKQ